LNSLLHCARAAPVAIAESHPGRAKEAADRYRIARSYAHYTDLLDQPDIDAVLVAVPNHLHAQVVADALAARKHVLLEPPFALNAREAAKVVEAARKAKRVFMIAEALRLNRHTQAARRVVERGELGETYHARCFWLRAAGIPRIGSWYTQRSLAGGGCLAERGARVLDACLHLLGDFNVRSVGARVGMKFGSRGLGEMNWGRTEIDPKHPFEVEDFGVAWLHLDHGRTVLLESSWAAHLAPDAPECGLQLLGTHASVSLYPARLIRPSAAGVETVHLGAAPAESEDPVHHFVSCVLDGRRPAIAPEESLKLQRIVDAWYSAAASAKEVRVE
jgi:predicted dehydrogenase